MAVTRSDTNEAWKFIYRNLDNLLIYPLLEVLPNHTKVSFKMSESDLMEHGISFMTQSNASYHNHSVCGASICDSEFQVSGYHSFGDVLSNNIRKSITDVDNGNGFCKVKFNLSDYDHLSNNKLSKSRGKVLSASISFHKQ